MEAIVSVVPTGTAKAVTLGTCPLAKERQPASARPDAAPFDDVLPQHSCLLSESEGPTATPDTPLRTTRSDERGWASSCAQPIIRMLDIQHSMKSEHNHNNCIGKRTAHDSSERPATNQKNTWSCKDLMTSKSPSLLCPVSSKMAIICGFALDIVPPYGFTASPLFSRTSYPNSPESGGSSLFRLPAPLTNVSLPVVDAAF